MRYRFTLVTIGLILFGWNSGQAQDFHYSQFFNAPVYLNPALTGVFNGDLRLQGNYRDQWTDVPVSYRTFSLMVDKKFIRRTDRSSFFAAGLGLNYDQAGDGRLSWGDLNFNAAYTQYLSDGMFLTFGGRATLAQRRFEPEALRFADQFNFGTGSFDPGFRTGEDFARTNHVFPDFSLGVNFHWQALDRYERYDYKKERSKIDVGIALMHLTTPDQTFIEDVTVPLYRRFGAYAQGVLQLNQPLDLVAGITGQFQGPYREYVAMGGLRVHLDTDPGKQISLQGAVGYRFAEFGDAFYPMLQLEYNAFRVGFSYDINISDFNVATQRNGGPELSVRYVFKKVRPVPSRRFCPLI